MQQTDKYKLNKPGVDDPITPVPLNENMDKIEAALGAKTGAAETAALTQRVVELEKLHFVRGVYTGTGVTDEVLELGFTPVVVLFYKLLDLSIIWVQEGSPWTSSIQLVPGGIRFHDKDLVINRKDALTPYFAFGLDA